VKSCEEGPVIYVSRQSINQSINQSIVHFGFDFDFDCFPGSTVVLARTVRCFHSGPVKEQQQLLLLLLLLLFSSVLGVVVGSFLLLGGGFGGWRIVVGHHFLDAESQQKELHGHFFDVKGVAGKEINHDEGNSSDQLGTV
jgi:hypothetical protein